MFERKKKLQKSLCKTHRITIVFLIETVTSRRGGEVASTLSTCANKWQDAIWLHNDFYDNRGAA